MYANKICFIYHLYINIKIDNNDKVIYSLILILIKVSDDEER